MPRTIPALLLMLLCAIALAAPVPKADGTLSKARLKEFDEQWKQLSQSSNESVQATLWFAKQPETTHYIKQKLRPLKMEEKEAKQLIAKLFSEQEDEWKEAERDLVERCPLLAMPITDVWAEAKTHAERRRLAWVLLGKISNHENDQYELKEHAGGVFTLVFSNWENGRQKSSIAVKVDASVIDQINNQKWQRLQRAIYLLEHIGTPEAVKIIEEMATGHPEASPTKTAKEALKRIQKMAK